MLGRPAQHRKAHFLRETSSSIYCVSGHASQSSTLFPKLILPQSDYLRWKILCYKPHAGFTLETAKLVQILIRDRELSCIRLGYSHTGR